VRRELLLTLPTLSLCPDFSNERGEKHVTETQVNSLARFAALAALFAVTKV